MSIERKYVRANVENLFFPVVEKPVCYTDESSGKLYTIPKHKALVDDERGTVLSVVSDRYRLVDNRKAFEMVRPIADSFFGGKGLDDFECFNLLMPKTRASCRIDLTRRSSCDFTLQNGDKYMAFIRMANSYNRSSRLTLIIGFCRWICMNGCIFGQKSYTFSVNHTDKSIRDPEFTKKVVKDATKEIGDLATMQREFSDALTRLEQIRMTPSQIRSLFCRVNGIELDKAKVESLTEAKWENLVSLDSRLNELISAYVNDFGESAYAAYNVMTDYASYPREGMRHPIRTPAYQRRVGDWLDGFTRFVSSGDCDLEDYFGEYEQSASLLAELKKSPPNSNADPHTDSRVEQTDLGF